MNPSDLRLASLDNNATFKDLQSMMEGAAKQGQFKVEMANFGHTDYIARCAIEKYLKEMGFYVDYDSYTQTLTVTW